MKEIIARSYSVQFSQKGFDKLYELIQKNNYSSLFVIVDSNTKKYCLPIFKKAILTETHLISI
jgi:3-dehydroquinate synthase